MPPLDHDTRCQEDCLSGQRHTSTFEHYPKEDDQVAITGDEGEDVIYGSHLSSYLDFPLRTLRSECHSMKKVPTTAAQEVASK